ncbi:MAG: RidA family protein, partial [Kofleriaceae bacterium]
WNADGVLASASTPHETFVAQFGQALDNVIAVVRAAGGSPTDLASMTVFVTDMAAYRATRKELAAIWKLRLGKHFPAMALVAVTALFEPDAVVEIQAIAHLGVTP